MVVDRQEMRSKNMIIQTLSFHLEDQEQQMQRQWPDVLRDLGYQPVQ